MPLTLTVLTEPEDVATSFAYTFILSYTAMNLHIRTEPFYTMTSQFLSLKNMVCVASCQGLREIAFRILI